MSRKRTLLTNRDYPGYCTCHVRDPKVWCEDGSYRMVLGARSCDDKGCVLFFSSADLYEWRFDKALSLNGFGYMWECPDVIVVGGHRFLGISPQGMQHGEFTHQNVYSSGYFRFDDELCSFDEWDFGFDFYAPQTFTAPDGRVLLIGWMGISDIPYENPTAELGWQHCLTLPRELFLREDGGICQRPISELDRLKGTPEAFGSGARIKTVLPFYMKAAAPCGELSLSFDGILKMFFAQGVFVLSFFDEISGGGRGERKVKISSVTALEIVADRTSLEVFINGGEKVMSTRFYPEDTEVTIITEGMTGEISPLGDMEILYND